MSTPYDWRINDIERKAERAYSRLHEIDSLRRDVDSLEHSNRSLCACIDGLRASVEACLERIQQLERQVEELAASAPGATGGES